MASAPPSPLSISSSSTLSMRSFSSLSLHAIKPRLSVRIFSSSTTRRRRHHHSHWGFYKLFSSSDPTLYTSTGTTTTTSSTSSTTTFSSSSSSSTTTCSKRPVSSPLARNRSHSYCERILSMKELTRKSAAAANHKPTSVMSIRAMELEALIDNYPHYTLHLTLTPRLCLEA